MAICRRRHPCALELGDFNRSERPNSTLQQIPHCKDPKVLRHSATLSCLEYYFRQSRVLTSLCLWRARAPR